MKYTDKELEYYRKRHGDHFSFTSSENSLLQVFYVALPIRE